MLAQDGAQRLGLLGHELYSLMDQPLRELRVCRQMLQEEKLGVRDVDAHRRYGPKLPGSDAQHQAGRGWGRKVSLGEPCDVVGPASVLRNEEKVSA